ncbi:MAG: hypothetical protein KGL53_06675, partial [Elusimicrobia bacterium]|nr:hypothetical protein [Elusimicrobiota bacterium]
LERLLHGLGAGTTGYTPLDPPTAVLVLDDAAMSGSPGDALFARLTAAAAYSYDADFWALLPRQYGAATARAGWQLFRGEPPSVWPRDPHYLMYRKAMHSTFESLCKDDGRRACVSWRAQLLTGLADQSLQRLARTAVDEALRLPYRDEPVGDSDEDPVPARARPALRVVPEMRDLALKLRAKGFDVWLFSSSSQYAALEAARLYGVDPSRVVGVRQKVADGVVTASLLQPIPLGEGLAEAVTFYLGRPPDLAVGSADDRALLDYDDGTGVRVLLAAPDQVPPDAARRGWKVQPPFSPSRGPQQESELLPPPSVPPGGGT